MLLFLHSFIYWVSESSHINQQRYSAQLSILWEVRNFVRKWYFPKQQLPKGKSHTIFSSGMDIQCKLRNFFRLSFSNKVNFFCQKSVFLEKKCSFPKIQKTACLLETCHLHIKHSSTSIMMNIYIMPLDVVRARSVFECSTSNQIITTAVLIAPIDIVSFVFFALDFGWKSDYSLTYFDPFATSFPAHSIVHS